MANRSVALIRRDPSYVVNAVRMAYADMIATEQKKQARAKEQLEVVRRSIENRQEKIDRMVEGSDRLESVLDKWKRDLDEGADEAVLRKSEVAINKALMGWRNF